MNNKRLIYLANSTVLGMAACGTVFVKHATVEEDVTGVPQPTTPYVEQPEIRSADGATVDGSL